MYQKDLIDEDILNRLSKARKIRNKLVHQGINVDEQTAKDILEVAIRLIKIIAVKSNLEDLNFDNNKIYNGISNDFQPNFKAWKNLPDSNFVENVFGNDITKKVKK